MSDFQTSIVIPVFNGWNLTSQCLQSLASTTDAAKTEIIVIDNASADATPESCPVLGRSLFGDSFLYLRNEQNRNFAGASNQGAAAARGDFIVFLNNDTAAQPGWLQPLLDDFGACPGIAATAPLLLYPDIGPLGRTVQHLGVTFWPFQTVGHLYSDIPAASPLARKRRFFSAITGACMVMPKNIFAETGGFDENFIIGFEDVDFCLRLTRAGYRMTVNPDSVVVHYESMTEGRHANESGNSEYFWTKNGARPFAADLHKHLAKDKLFPSVNEWLRIVPATISHEESELDSLASTANPEELKALVINYPYWKNGWRALIDKTADPGEQTRLAISCLNLLGTPGDARFAFELGRKTGLPELEKYGLALAEKREKTPENYLKRARYWQKRALAEGFADLAAQYGKWIGKYNSFLRDAYLPAVKDFLQITRSQGE